MFIFICLFKTSPAEVTNIMAAVRNFQKKLTEENKAEFVAKLDNIVTGFALKVPVEKGGSILFSSLKVFNIKLF